MISGRQGQLTYSRISTSVATVLDEPPVFTGWIKAEDEEWLQELEISG
jgi:hypothetical protein